MKIHLQHKKGFRCCNKVTHANHGLTTGAVVNISGAEEIVNTEDLLTSRII